MDFDAKVVSPDTLKRAVSAFVDLLRGVSENVVGGGEKRIQWNMCLSEGSRLVVAHAVTDPETQRASELVIHVLQDGLKRLERDTPSIPSYFDERCLRAARELAMLRSENKGLDYVRIRSTGRPTEISERSSVCVDRLLGGQHQALGAIEGKLQTLSDRQTLQFVVYDSLYDRGVNCFIREDLVPQAMKAFRKRVAVTGVIQYDREGRPVSIRVEGIREFKDDADLPTVKSMRGIFKRSEVS